MLLKKLFSGLASHFFLLSGKTNSLNKLVNCCDDFWLQNHIKKTTHCDNWKNNIETQNTKKYIKTVICIHVFKRSKL